MASLKEIMKDIGNKDERLKLDKVIRSLQLDIENGITTVEQARKQLQQYKDLQNYNRRKGMTCGS